MYTAADAEHPADFKRIPSVNGDYKVVPGNMSWTAAGQKCRSLHPDAHLLVISDAQKQSAIAGLLNSTNRQFMLSSYRFIIV